MLMLGAPIQAGYCCPRCGHGSQSASALPPDLGQSPCYLKRVLIVIHTGKLTMLQSPDGPRYLRRVEGQHITVVAAAVRLAGVLPAHGPTRQAFSRSR
jgi:hypothetical protein